MLEKLPDSTAVLFYFLVKPCTSLILNFASSVNLRVCAVEKNLTEALNLGLIAH